MPITIEGGDTVVFSEETVNRYIEVITKSVEEGGEPRISDLLMLADTVTTTAEPAKMKETADTLTLAVASKQSMSQSETTQVSMMLKDLTSAIVAEDNELA